METTIGQRFKQLIKELGIKPTELAGHGMTSKQNINAVITDVNQPGAPVIINILRAFPHVDANWLLLGRGNMFLNPELYGTVNENLKEIEHLKKEIEHLKEVIKLKDELLEVVRSKLKSEKS